MCKLCVSVWIQSDDTDGTTANEDEALHQQQNNTRATVVGASGNRSKPNPRELTLSSKARYSSMSELTLDDVYSCFDSILNRYYI